MGVATYNVRTLAVKGRTGMGMTSVYWRRDDNLAVTLLVAGNSESRQDDNQCGGVPSFLFRSGENNSQARVIRS